MRIRLLLLAVSLAAVVVFGGEDPLTLSPSQDTTINPTTIGSPAEWTAKAEDLMVYGPKHGNKDYRSLIQFDLKDVPKLPVSCAILKLTIYKMYAVRKNKQDIVRIHRLLRPWLDTAVSWGHSVPGDEWYNKGGDFDPIPVAATPLNFEATGDAPGKSVEFDVTPLAQAWQAGQPNFGMILINADNDSETTFRPYSGDAKNTSDRPKLTLYWANPPKKNPEFIKPTTLKPIGGPISMNIQLNPSLKQGRVGEKYDDFIKGKGGIAPYTYKVQGELPDGLTVTPEGLIQGKPTKAGKYSVSVSITDAQRHGGSGRLSFDVVEPDKVAAGKKEGDKPADKPEAKKPEKPIQEE